MEFGREPARRVGAGRQHDARDQGAQQLCGLVLDALVIERDLELGDLAPVEFREVRVEFDRLRCCRLCDLALDLFPPVLQRPQAISEATDMALAFDRSDDGGNLALDALEFGFVAPAVIGDGSGSRTGFLLVGGHKFCHELRRKQPVLEAGEHAGFDRLACDADVVAAASLRTAVSTAVAILADDRVGTTADAAGQETAQQELAAVCPVEGVAVRVLAHLDMDGALALLHTLPEIVVDDAEIRNLDHLPSRALVDAGDALSGTGVLLVGNAVPLDAADVAGVVQEAGPAVRLPSNGCVAPLAAGRAGHAFAVERLGDRPRRPAGGEFLEDTPHDYSFGGVDPAPAAFDAPVTVGAEHLVAISYASRDPALAHTPELASPCLLAEVGDIELRHGSEHADVHRRHLARCQRVNLDAAEVEAVVEIGDVGELATEAVERLADDDVEAPALGVLHQLLEAGPEPARAAYGTVVVDPRQRPALAHDLTPADFDLILDGSFALKVGRVAGVDDGPDGRSGVVATKGHAAVLSSPARRVIPPRPAS